MDEASEILMWNSPHKCGGPKTWCFTPRSHKHLSRRKHHTSIHRKAIKIQNLLPASHGIQPKPMSGWLFSLRQGEAVLLFVLLANSWADPPSSTMLCRMKHPFGKCQSLWLTSCCNKHGKGSVSLSDYSCYVLQKEYVRTVSPLQSSQSQRQEFSHCKQNQGKTSQARSSLSIHPCIIHLGRLEWGWKFPSHGRDCLEC